MPAARSLFSALSSNSSGSRPFKPRDAGATPVRAAIFLKEAPVLDPRPESALPYRIRMKPAGGPSPAGAEFTMRSWRKSNAPVCQSGVGSASLPERTNGAVVFNSQHSGLLIRTVRVQLPPAPPVFNPRSLRTDVREVFSRRVT